MKTILITGCSSGFGLETARLFLARDWKVIATMRKPQEDILPASPNLRVLPLDVTDAASIEAAVAAAGPIDALVNNAGIGWLNALEGTSPEAIREVFETNTIGTMAVTQAFLPQFRARRDGVIVNVTSAVTLKPLILLPVYTASKAAVNAFTECLALELAPFNIRASIVLPGQSQTTRFGDNFRAKLAKDDPFPEPYQDIVQGVFRQWGEDKGPKTEPLDVAEAVWQAVTDPAAPMRIPAGADAVALAASA